MNKRLTRCYIHCVFSTKRRQSLLTENLLKTAICFLKEMNSRDFNILETNGHLDHIHLLVEFDSVISIGDILKQVKGSSSRFINKTTNSEATHFEWQEGYAVFTVRPTQINSVLGYIQNQKRHHQNKSFQHELEEIQIKLQDR